MIKIKKALLFSCLPFALAACYDEQQVVLNLTPNAGVWSFYDQGFPTDLRVKDDGHLDLHGFPQPLNLAVQEFRKVAERDSLGYTPDMPLYMRFRGDFESTDLSLPADPLASAQTTSTVQLINVDANSVNKGQRYPIKVSFLDSGDGYRPKRLLQALPVGRFLDENTTYALVVTKGIAGEKADELTANPVLNALLNGENPRTVESTIPTKVADKALRVYAPLKNYWLNSGGNVDDIVGAIVWTTGNPTEQLEALGQAVSRWSAPTPEDGLKLIKETDQFCLVGGSLTVPGIQKGLLPYILPINGGQIEYNEAGEPIVQYQRTTPFVLTLPKTPMPATGYPIVYYHHGTAGDANQVFERGVTLPGGELTQEGNVSQIAAIRGWASAGMGGHFGAEHQKQLPLIDKLNNAIPVSGLSLNLAAYNILNPQAMRDNLLQMVSERILFRKMVNQLTVDTSLCPSLPAIAGTNQAFFDLNTQVLMGQSLGSFTSGLQTVADPLPAKGYVATGAGAYDLKLMMHFARLPNRLPLGNILEPLFFSAGVNDIVMDPFHPIYALTNNVLSKANFVNGLAHLSTDPLNQHKPQQLTVAGYFDDWVTVPSQLDYLRASGSDYAGTPLPNVPEQDRFLPALTYAGAANIGFPAQGNDQGRTNIVVRYAEDGIKSGHNVFFQQNAAKHQVGCFFQDISKGLIPTIVEGDNDLAGACASGSPSLH